MRESQDRIVTTYMYSCVDSEKDMNFVPGNNASKLKGNIWFSIHVYPYT